MEIKEKFKSIFTKDKKTLILFVIGIIGILIILASEFVPSSHDKKKSADLSVNQYIQQLEDETADLVGSIYGVGKCKVMITVKDTNEFVYAKNSDETSNDSNYSKSYEYVFYDGANGDEPVLIKQYLPKIQGVAVVCEGADNSAIQSQVLSTISSLYNISTSKISISKLG